MDPPPAADPVRAALIEFCDDIERTGGVVQDGQGITAPNADLSWSDLGTTYLHACAALGRKPEVTVDEPDDDGDD